MFIEAKDLFKKDVIVVYKNWSDKKFHLAESQSMIAHVDYMFSTQMNMSQFKVMKSDVLSGKVTIEIIEICDDKFIRRTKLLKYRNDLLADGYTEYSSTRFVDAKVKTKLTQIGKSLYVLVYLAVGNKPKTVLGVFDKMDDANQFKKDHYPDDRINDDSRIVIADNELTKKLIDHYTF
jgi:hypothetical protein